MPITTQLLVGPKSKTKRIVRATTTRAFNQGKSAFAEGLAMGSCPYSTLTQAGLQSAWATGFKLALHASKKIK